MQYKLHCCVLQKVRLGDLMKWVDLLNSASVCLRATNCGKTGGRSWLGEGGKLHSLPLGYPGGGAKGTGMSQPHSDRPHRCALSSQAFPCSVLDLCCLCLWKSVRERILLSWYPRRCLYSPVPAGQHKPRDAVCDLQC